MTILSRGSAPRAAAVQTVIARPAFDVEAFGHILDSVGSQLMVADADLVIRYANPRAKAALEALREHLPCAPESIIGTPLNDCLAGALETNSPADHWAALPLSVRNATRSETIEVSVQPVYGAGGERIAAVATLECVTERRALQKDNAMLRSMIETSSANMMVANRDHVVDYMNPASYATLRRLEAYLPIPVDQVVGSSLDLFHGAPDRARTILDHEDRLPHRMRIQVGPETLELLISALRDADGTYAGSMATWEIVTELVRAERINEEAEADADAINRVLAAMQRAATPDEAVRVALDSVRSAFDWAYGSYWTVEADRLLHFSLESGDVSPEFRAVTLSSTFAEGIGLSGRTWRQRDLYFTQDIGEMADCVRAPVAQKVGVRSGVCFPILIEGEVVGTMDFFAMETLEPSPQRLEALRNVGRMVSQRLESLARAARDEASAAHTSAGVQRILDGVQAAVAGDLTLHLSVEGDDPLAQVSGALDELIGQFRVSLANIGGTANSLSVSAEQLTSLAQGMGDGAIVTSEGAGSASRASSEVSSAIQTVAVAAEQMTTSIREIAKNATEAATVATSAVQVADGAQETVASLGDSSAEIGQVIKVITGIAQQTNLLALNATIEAARAGDAGKGFAVVANEVKELAKETAKATEDISGRIEAIQSDSRSAVAAISRISEVIARINDIQSTIASAVEEQTVTTNEIARSVTEAAAGADGITSDINQVAAAAAENQEGAQDTLRSATDLAAIATELRTLVARFTL